jgi:hypothetical protein
VGDGEMGDESEGWRAGENGEARTQVRSGAREIAGTEGAMM